MAQKLFTGQYGPLSQVDTRPIMAAGQAWGQAIQGTLENVSKAIEKHKLDKIEQEMKPQFIQQAIKQGMDAETAEVAWKATSKSGRARGAEFMQSVNSRLQREQQAESIKLTHQRLNQQIESDERARKQQSFNNYVTVMGNNLSQGKELDPANLQVADEIGQGMGLPPGMARNLAEAKAKAIKQQDEVIRLKNLETQTGIDVSKSEFDLRKYISGEELDLAKDRLGLQEDEFNWRKGLEKDKLALQRLQLMASTAPKDQKLLDDYRKEVKARLDDILEVKHAGKTYNLSIAQIEEGVADGSLPKALLQSSRYQEQLKRISAARQPLDKLIRSKTVLVDVPDDGEGAGTVLQDPAARGGIVNEDMTPEVASAAVSDEISRYSESLKLMRARARNSKTTIGEKQKIAQEIERQARALKELKASQYYSPPKQRSHPWEENSLDASWGYF